MLPPGIEFRPELSTGNDVLAVGFPGTNVDSDHAITILSSDLINYISKETIAVPCRIMVDLRNVSFLSSDAFGKLIALNKRLRQLSWELVLVLDDPTMRNLFATTHLDPIFTIVTSAELRPFRSSETVLPPPNNSPVTEPRIEFTRQELNNMAATGVTLEDAIRAIEQLRG